MSALREFAGHTETEVLPVLQDNFLEELPSRPLQEVVQQFIAAKQFSGHVVTAHEWNRWGLSTLMRSLRRDWPVEVSQQ